VSEDLTREEVHQAVDRVVDDLLARAGVTGPPVDVLALARDHPDLFGPGGGKGSRRRAAGKREAAGIELPEEQRQWAAAREVGARFKAAVLERLGLAPEDRGGLSGESVAGLFAGHLLAPTGWFAADARAAGWDLAELKRRYRTAPLEALAWRLLDLPEPCVITLVDDGRVRRRRSNAWRVNKTLSAPERACQRYVHEHGRPHVVAAGGWTVQGWPFRQAGRACEILRGVRDADGGDAVPD
jgi:hypothetical protein